MLTYYKASGMPIFFLAYYAEAAFKDIFYNFININIQPFPLTSILLKMSTLLLHFDDSPYLWQIMVIIWKINFVLNVESYLYWWCCFPEDNTDTTTIASMTHIE